MLDFFAFRVNRYLGNALTAASGNGAFAPIENAIETKIWLDPAAIAKAEQFKFPLLSVWRKSSRYDHRTMNWAQETSTVGVAYLLPPMSAGQALRIQPALTAVGRIIQTSIDQGFDPGYNDGERVFLTAETARTKLISGTFGRYELGDTMDFHAFVGEIELHEQTMPYTVGLTTLDVTDLVITDESVEPGNPITMIEATLPEP